MSTFVELARRSPAPTFIVTSGRAGSTLLSRMLLHHPAILSVSELLSMAGGPRVLGDRELAAAQYFEELARLTPDMRALLRCTRIPEVLADPERALLAPLSSLELVTLPQLSPEPAVIREELRAWAARGGMATPGQHLAALLACLGRRFERPFWVERSGGSLEYVDRLSAHFPEARLIHLVRDGRDTAYSMAHHPMFRVHLARLLARDPELPVEHCLALEIPLHRFAAYWSALMWKGTRQLEKHRIRGEVLVVRYEDLVTAPARELARISTFVTGEPGSSRWLITAAQLVQVQPARWTSLEGGVRSEFEAACRPGMRCLTAGEQA